MTTSPASIVPTPLEIANHVRAIIQEFSQSIWVKHPQYGEMVEDLCQEIEAAGFSHEAAAILFDAAIELATTYSQNVENQTGTTLIDGQAFHSLSALFEGPTSAALNAVCMIIAPHFGREKFVAVHLRDVISPAWTFNNPIMYFEDSQSRTLLIEKTGEVMVGLGGTNIALDYVRNLYTSQGNEEAARVMTSYGNFLAIGLELVRTIKIDENRQPLLDSQALGKYVAQCWSIAEADAEITPVLSAYRYLIAASAIQAVTHGPATQVTHLSKEAHDECLTRSAGLLLLKDGEPTSDRYATQTDIIGTYSYAAQHAQIAGQTEIAVQLFAISRREAELTAQDPHADQAGLLEFAQHAVDGEFEALVGEQASDTPHHPEDICETDPDQPGIDDEFRSITRKLERDEPSASDGTQE